MTAWELDVFVPGKPAPQGSKMARPIYRGRGAEKVFTGKVAQVESSKSGVDEWRNDVRAACTAAWSGRAPLDGPLVLDVEFVRARLASAPKRSTPPAIKAPDLSKLVRSTEDAITSSGVWADDARVVRTVASKRFAEIGETPGARIRVAPWNPRPSASSREPASLDTLVEWFSNALEVSAIEVTVHELDLSGARGAESPLPRLVRCLRVNGLLDEGDLVSVGAVRALAAGEPLDEVADDYSADPALLRAIAPYVRPDTKEADRG